MFEHLYSIPRGPWLVLWCLYDLFMFLELCCDIFPWVPDLDRTRLGAWLVYDWIGGITSWYQSRLPVGIPLPHSLVEVESRHSKTFTNMVVWLTGPRRLWLVVGSLIPRLYSGIRISLLFGLNDFLKSNFRFSKTLSPGEPLRSRWSPAAPEDFEDNLRYSLQTLCPLLLQFPTTKISLWINT